MGKKGLADKLNKDPSLISRYASGAVRPKAETLLKCMAFLENEVSNTRIQSRSETSRNTYKLIEKAILNLSPENDTDVIEAIFKILQLAKKL